MVEASTQITVQWKVREVAIHGKPSMPKLRTGVPVAQEIAVCWSHIRGCDDCHKKSIIFVFAINFPLSTGKYNVMKNAYCFLRTCVHIEELKMFS